MLASTRQTYDYATPITCDKFHRKTIEVESDSDDQFFLQSRTRTYYTKTTTHVYTFSN